MMHPDLIICKNAKTKRDVKILGNDRYLHMLVIGPTGGGKTALSFKPFVYQDIEFIARGNHACVVIMEPDGAFTRDVAEYAEQLNVSCTYLDVTKPRAGQHWNPLEGSVLSVAERVTTVLSSTGTDNPYFKTVQQSASRNVIQLLKFLHGDDLDLEMVTDALRDMTLLKSKVGELEQKIKERDLNEDDEYTAKNVVKALKPKLADRDSMAHYSTVCDGLIEQLNNLIGNPNVRKTLCGKSTFTFDEIYERPGVLLINTGNDLAGDLFGMFALLSMQDATLSRPGDENTRPAVHTYIDEYGRYATPEYKTVFTQGRKYRNSHTIAIQSFSQLKVDDQYKEIVKTNTRNKIVLTGLEYEDAREASLMMGMKEEVDQSISYGDGGFFIKDNKRTSERKTEKSRFSANDLMFMDKNWIVYKFVNDRQPMPPEAGVVKFAERKTLEAVLGKANVDQQQPRQRIWKRGLPKLKLKRQEIVETTQEQPTTAPESVHMANSEVAAGKYAPPPVIPITEANREGVGARRNVYTHTPPPVTTNQTPPPVVPIVKVQTPPPVVVQEKVVEASPPVSAPIEEQIRTETKQVQELETTESVVVVDLFGDEEATVLTPYLDEFLEELDEVHQELIKSIAASGSKFRKSLSRTLEGKGYQLDEVIEEINQSAAESGLKQIIVDGNVIRLSDEYGKEITSWAKRN